MPLDREATLRKAEKLISQGKLDLAIGEYRALVDDQPTDLNSANALGDLYARSGDLDKAVATYRVIADHFAEQGFFPKASALYKKILKIKPDDEGVLWELAGLSERQGLIADARSALTAVSARRRARGDRRGEAEVRVRLGELDGADLETRLAGARSRVELGDVKGAVERLKQTAAELEDRGRHEDAVRVLAEAAEFDPEAEDIDVLSARADVDLRAGRIEDATVVLLKILAEDSGQWTRIVSLGCDVAESQPAAGFECAEVGIRAAIDKGEWAAAADALNDFVTRAPGHIPALVRLIELCVEAGLEPEMHNAQARLADAYLAAGSGVEARIIAEDLVAREPWETQNLERFRKALSLLGETEIDAIIASRFGGDPPFTTTVPPARREAVVDAPPKPDVRKPVAAPSPISAPAAVAAPPVAAKPAASSEVDLSEILHDLNAATAAPASGGGPPPDIESVLKTFQEDAKFDSSQETAEQHYKLGASYLQMGMPDEAQRAFEIAARSLRHRFGAASMLAKMFEERGERGRAIEWYERAAEAPASDAGAHHGLLYDLAALLEADGETARALAVFLELQTEAGNYRDVAKRLERLTAELGK